MKKTLMKAAVRAAAPRLRAKALKRASHWVEEVMSPPRRQSSMGMTAAKGLGAAAVAIPLGIWLGRRFLSGGESD